MLVASIAVWGKRTIFDTDRFTKVVASALDDPAVTSALATRLTDSAFRRGTEHGRRRRQRPAQLQPLIPVFRGVLRGFVEPTRSRSFLASDTGQQIMVRSVQAFPRAAMRVLEGENPGNSVNIENGAVVLNLVPAVNAVLGRLQERGVLTGKKLPCLDDSQSPRSRSARSATRSALT